MTSRDGADVGADRACENRVDVLTAPFDRDGVTTLSRVMLRADQSAVWPFAIAHAVEIDAHWHAALRTNPDYFNGVVHLVASNCCDGASDGRDDGLDAGQVLRLRLVATEFKAYLYWRDRGYPPAGVVDGFGSGLILSRDGAALVVRQRPGQINSGLFYLPGGFIDHRDVAADGDVDIAASVEREVAEETGLQFPRASAASKCLVARCGPHLSIAMSYQSGLTSNALLARVQAFIDADPGGELETAMTVRTLADLAGVAVAPYARMVLAHLWQTPCDVGLTCE